MHTIVELPEYKKRVEKLLSDDENKQIISYLAVHPKAGVLMQGTDGVRVVYYYHSEDIPLFMLSLFGKNEKTNLSRTERNVLSKLTKILSDSYRRQS